LKKLIVMAAAIAVAIIGFGGLTATTTHADPYKIWVVNQNVANYLNAGAVDFTALTDADVAQLDDFATASAGQIGPDMANAGDVFIVVQTDGSTNTVTLNGRGLACSSVTGGTLGVICDGAAVETPVLVGTSGQFIVWQITDAGTFADGNFVTATQDGTALNSEALNLVGSAHDISLTVTKDTIQEANSGSCGPTSSTSAPTRGAAVAEYVDINGNALVGYMPTFSSSSGSTMLVGDGTGAGDTSFQATTMLLSDGSTIAGYDVICGVAAGSATLSAKTTANEGTVMGNAGAVTRTQDITVTGVPASIALTASPATIACDGSATSTVTAKVTDADGNDVVDNTNVNFSVVALGTANPINVKTASGEASSTITPLSGSTAGVTVIVTSGDAQASIRVDCAQPVPTVPAATPTSTGGGVIVGPNTGTGGYLGQDGSAGFPMWTLVALVLGSLVLVGGGMVTRRAGK
jgi:hypothetical protein